MKLTVNGVPVPVADSIAVVVEIDPAGETLPAVNVHAVGGPLEVNRSCLSISGPIHIHPFREEEQ